MILANSAQFVKRLQIRETCVYGKGVFAGEEIEKGCIIGVLGGTVLTCDECSEKINNGEEDESDSLQVALELWMDLDELSRTFNHSCNPNAGIRKVSELFALKNICAGEQITYDYSLTVAPNITADLWAMACICGQNECRKLCIRNSRESAKKIYGIRCAARLYEE